MYRPTAFIPCMAASSRNDECATAYYCAALCYCRRGRLESDR